jgi:hypothetical protein
MQVFVQVKTNDRARPMRPGKGNSNSKLGLACSASVQLRTIMGMWMSAFDMGGVLLVKSDQRLP